MEDAADNHLFAIDSVLDHVRAAAESHDEFPEAGLRPGATSLREFVQRADGGLERLERAERGSVTSSVEIVDEPQQIAVGDRSQPDSAFQR